MVLMALLRWCAYARAHVRTHACVPGLGAWVRGLGSWVHARAPYVSCTLAAGGLSASASMCILGGAGRCGGSGGGRGSGGACVRACVRARACAFVSLGCVGRGGAGRFQEAGGRRVGGLPQRAKCAELDRGRCEGDTRSLWCRCALGRSSCTSAYRLSC